MGETVEQGGGVRHRLHPALGRFVAELEAQLIVNPVRLLHVDLLPLTAKKSVDATVPIADTRLPDLTDAGFDAGLLAAARFVVIRRGVHLENPASSAN